MTEHVQSHCSDSVKEGTFEARVLHASGDKVLVVGRKEQQDTSVGMVMGLQSFFSPRNESLMFAWMVYTP